MNVVIRLRRNEWVFATYSVLGKLRWILSHFQPEAFRVGEKKHDQTVSVFQPMNKWMKTCFQGVNLLTLFFIMFIYLGRERERERVQTVLPDLLRCWVPMHKALRNETPKNQTWNKIPTWVTPTVSIYSTWEWFSSIFILWTWTWNFTWKQKKIRAKYPRFFYLPWTSCPNNSYL